ncbi:MAG: hemin-degrading factor [Flavobacteriales bacterium]|nr:hemin-degrading factor [Flavobacteriales bacterium]
MNTEVKSPLFQKWQALIEEKPMRIRNAAQELEVSEFELLTSACPDNKTAILNFEFGEMMRAFEAAGDLMALTRNAAVVHERKGHFKNFSQPNNHVALFVNDEIDIRLFPSVWTYAAAVTVTSRGKDRLSIQFFDNHGDAVFKVYWIKDSKVQAYHDFVDRFRASEQQPVHIAPTEKKEPKRAHLNEDQIAEFQQKWIDLKDTHDFFPLLHKYKVTRMQALELSPKGPEEEWFDHYAVEQPTTILRQLFEAARDEEIEIMVFVGNRGNIQIHTGPVKNLVDYDQWFNVMDKRFNLHLNMDHVHRTWVVNKPTEDGMVTSLEVFDEKEEMIVQIFGKRKPGIPELPAWRNALINTVQ